MLRGRAAQALAILAPLVVALAVEAGGLAAVDRAASDASRLRAAGHYSDAIAELDDAASRSGPAYLFARSGISSAGVDAEEATLDWARALASAGRVDEALEMTGRITDPSVRADADRAAAQIALDDARRQAATGHADVALARLDTLEAGHPPADLGDAAAALRPGYAVAAARILLDQGQPRKAVAALDLAVAAGAGGVIANAADDLYPAALLAAGQAALGAQDGTDALTLLDRLVGRFAASTQAATARRLLAAGQPVSGTLVHRDGTPAGFVGVRLGSDFRKAGTGFLTSPPYYYARTDGDGSFMFQAIPVGAHLTLEIFDRGQWTVLEATDATSADEKPVYQVDVAPLTPVDLAFVRLTT